MESVKRLKLESSRLILEPISMDYAEVIFQELTAEITRFMHPKPAENINETIQFIRDAMRHQENGSDFTFVILKKDNSEFLGVCGVHRINTDTPELGIWTKKSAHGHGYGREAIHCLKTWVDELIEYQYLLYPVDKRNIPSQKIPESLKGKPYREYTQLNLSGHTLHVIEYRIYR
ncbi:GNAT family N-acetyltransferase [Leptothermofonsia sp. ETS-13]|uniref:GNAT family N-acetyltransferase n=1 Tax=Leptothermofonsia sp. ETS-13 TaxID=3035696 RepID=UPI003BA2AFE8